MSQLTLTKRPLIPLTLSKESVTLNVHIEHFAPENQGEAFEVDSSSITIRRGDCISSADYIRDIVKVFRDRGVRFDETGSDWAQSPDAYMDPITGIVSRGSVHFDGDPDYDLLRTVQVLTDARDY